MREYISIFTIDNYCVTLKENMVLYNLRQKAHPLSPHFLWKCQNWIWCNIIFTTSDFYAEFANTIHSLAIRSLHEHNTLNSSCSPWAVYLVYKMQKSALLSLTALLVLQVRNTKHKYHSQPCGFKNTFLFRVNFCISSTLRKSEPRI